VFSFLAAQYGSISDIEIVWTLIAIFGGAFSIHNLKESITDRKVLKTAGIENGRMLLANVQVKAESCRLIIQTIFLGIGLSAMTFKDSPDQVDLPLRLVLFSFFIQWGLIVAALLIAYKSYLGWRVRQDFLQQDHLTRALLTQPPETPVEATKSEDIPNGQHVITGTIEGVIDSNGVGTVDEDVR
jgi:hypothetical protein